MSQQRLQALSIPASEQVARGFPFPPRVLLPVGYGSQLHRSLIDQALVWPTALLVDVRWSPRSRLPGWGGAALRLRYGKRYLPLGHVLGNMAYRSRQSGQIQIADLGAGIQQLLGLLDEQSPLLLLCGCATYEQCHRRIICEAIQAADPSVAILQPEQLPPMAKIEGRAPPEEAQ